MPTVAEWLIWGALTVFGVWLEAHVGRKWMPYVASVLLVTGVRSSGGSLTLDGWK